MEEVILNNPSISPTIRGERRLAQISFMMLKWLANFSRNFITLSLPDRNAGVVSRVSMGTGTIENQSMASVVICSFGSNR